MIDDIVQKVMARLSSIRIGVLWGEEILKTSGIPSICWIAYREGPLPPHVVGYDLSIVDEPEAESYSLDGLIVPFIRPSILREVLLFPDSPSARLIAGCLGRELPVVIDLSAIKGWSAWQGPIGERLRSSIEQLKKMGCSFTSWCDKNEEPHRLSLSIDEPGWYSWIELSKYLNGVNELNLASGVKITDEARERIVGSGISIRRKPSC